MLYRLVGAVVNLLQANSRFERSWHISTQKKQCKPKLLYRKSWSSHCIEQYEFASRGSQNVLFTPNPQLPILILNSLH